MKINEYFNVVEDLFREHIGPLKEVYDFEIERGAFSTFRKCSTTPVYNLRKRANVPDTNNMVEWGIESVIDEESTEEKSKEDNAVLNYLSCEGDRLVSYVFNLENSKLVSSCYSRPIEIDHPDKVLSKEGLGKFVKWLGENRNNSKWDMIDPKHG